MTHNPGLQTRAPRNRLPVLLLTLGLGLSASPATGDDAGKPDDGSPGEQDAADYGATARVVGRIAARNPEDTTAAGTTIQARERGRALEEVSEALDEVPGARIQRTGGLGAFSGISLRGAELGHTAVLLGQIPLSTADDLAFDLSYLPLSALERIEVYRGGAPAWHSAGAIGGVLRLVPAEAARTRAWVTAGAGAFGRREALATASVVGDGALHPAVLTHMRLARADNDFPYLADGSTRFVSDDDRELMQRNGDILATDGLLHAGLDALGGRISLLLSGHGRVQGIPGPLSQETRSVRRRLVRALAGLSYERDALDADGQRRYRFQLVASASHQHNSLTDLVGLSGELGAGQHDTDDVWQRGFLRVGGGYRVLPFLEPSLIATVQQDRYHPEDSGDAAVAISQADSMRTTASATLEARMYGPLADGVRAELRPSMRQTFSWTEIALDTGLSQTAERLSQRAPTFRLAGVIEPLPGLAISASVADGRRLPSMADLFGDRVYLEANPDLRPERSLTSDLGVVVRGRLGDLRGALETRGFALFIDDLIAHEQTSAQMARAKNIASARILGVEAGVSGHYGRHLQLTASLTAMDTKNHLGRPVLLRPPLQVLARPQLIVYPGPLDRLSLFAEGHHVSFAYWSDSINASLPARTMFAAGLAASMWEGALALEARLHNLLDTRAYDVLSRPLPGRDFRLSATLTLE